VRAVALVTVALLVLGGCGDGDDGGDLGAFCDAVDRLERNDPFAELDIASPGEMAAAFDQLSEGAGRIADQAPPAARSQARSYEASVEDLVDQLRGAGFDPTQVDALAYREAAADYQAAAVAVENAAGSLCG
jgi:hypothetical protein